MVSDFNQAFPRLTGSSGPLERGLWAAWQWMLCGQPQEAPGRMCTSEGSLDRACHKAQS
jgi:hypothetical protein